MLHLRVKKSAEDSNEEHESAVDVGQEPLLHIEYDDIITRSTKFRSTCREAHRQENLSKVSSSPSRDARRRVGIHAAHVIFRNRMFIYRSRSLEVS